MRCARWRPRDALERRVFVGRIDRRGGSASPMRGHRARRCTYPTVDVPRLGSDRRSYGRARSPPSLSGISRAAVAAALIVASLIARDRAGLTGFMPAARLYGQRRRTRTPMSTHHVVIAGGGVAGLEALIALRAPRRRRVRITLLAPTDEFLVPRAQRRGPVREAGAARATRSTAICGDHGAELVRDARRVRRSRGAHARRPTSGDGAAYDSLLVAVGARPSPAFDARPDLPRHAGRRGACTASSRTSRAATSASIAFVVPPGTTWPLPLYELALMTAERAYGMGDGRADHHRHARVAAARRSSAARRASSVDAMLAERGIVVRTDAHVSAVEGGTVIAAPGGVEVRAQRVVVLPRLPGPRVRGLPADPHGFLPVDEHGRVRDAADVYGAGDGTDAADQAGRHRRPAGRRRDPLDRRAAGARRQPAAVPAGAARRAAHRRRGRPTSARRWPAARATRPPRPPTRRCGGRRRRSPRPTSPRTSSASTARDEPGDGLSRVPRRVLHPPHVVVAGGGFAGVEALLALRDLAGDRRRDRARLGAGRAGHAARTPCPRRSARRAPSASARAALRGARRDAAPRRGRARRRRAVARCARDGRPARLRRAAPRRRARRREAAVPRRDHLRRRRRHRAASRSSRSCDAQARVAGSPSSSPTACAWPLPLYELALLTYAHLHDAARRRGSTS